MINNYVQLYSWILSIIIGFIYSIILRVYFLIIRNRRFSIRMLLHFLLITLISSLIVICYLEFNGNLLHYSYILFWIIGYMFGNNNKIVKLVCKLTRKDK